VVVCSRPLEQSAQQMSASESHGELEEVAKRAAELAVAKAERQLEEVLREALQILRADLRSEIKEVADVATKADCMVSSTASAQEGIRFQLLACLGSQEEMKGQIQELKTELSARDTQSKVGLGSELQEILPTLSELRLYVESSKEEMSKQASDLQSQLSAIKTESVHDQLLEFKGQMQEMQAKLKESTALRTATEAELHSTDVGEQAKSQSGESLVIDVATQSDLAALQELLVGQLSDLRERVVRLSESGPPFMQAQIMTLHQRVEQVCKDQADSVDKMDVLEVQKQMNVSLSELHTFVGNLVKRSSEKECLAKVAALEVQVQKLLESSSQEKDSSPALKEEKLAESSSPALQKSNVANKVAGLQYAVEEFRGEVQELRSESSFTTMLQNDKWASKLAWDVQDLRSQANNLRAEMQLLQSDGWVSKLSRDVQQLQVEAHSARLEAQATSRCQPGSSWTSSLDQQQLAERKSEPVEQGGMFCHLFGKPSRPSRML